MKLKNVINKHKSNKIKENSNTVRHLNNGTDHRHSKSCCDKSSPARRTMISWWHHQMGTFSALLAICAGNSSFTGEFPAQRPVTRSFDVFFHLRMDKRLSKPSRRWWLETPSCSLWRHSNDNDTWSIYPVLSLFVTSNYIYTTTLDEMVWTSAYDWRCHR